MLWYLVHMKKGSFKSRLLFVLLILSVVLGLTSCISLGSSSDDSVSNFYHQWISDEAMNSIEDDAFLQEGEEPIVYYVSGDMQTEYNFVQSNFYFAIADSNFNGPASSLNGLESELTEIAKEKGAKVVIYGRTYTKTISNVYSNSYGVYSSNIDRYDYDIYYFISTPEAIIMDNPLGFIAHEMDQSQREKYKRNTGLLITTVWNKTPAYYANLALNDIIVGINEVEILDKNSYYYAVSQIDVNKPIRIDFIRNGIQQTTTINL